MDLDDIDFDTLMEFLDLTSKEPLPQLSESVLGRDLSTPNPTNYAEEEQEVQPDGGAAPCEAAAATAAPAAPSIGKLYCHVCKEHRTVESYWNCHKKNHLLNLFFSESQQHLRSATLAHDSCPEFNIVCIPNSRDYSFQKYDAGKILQKIKIKK